MAAPSPAPVVAPEPDPGNPFEWAPLFRAAYEPPEQAAIDVQSQDPLQAPWIATIVEQPQAVWLGGWSGDIRPKVDAYVSAAAAAGRVPLLVAYNVPHRDCGHYSGGGADQPEAYREWIRDYAAAIGERPAIVVLEPDAVPQLTECLSEVDQAQRLALIAYAVDTFGALPAVAVYIDAGHSNWVPAAELARRLRLAGVERARGFTLNVSNFEADAPLRDYGHAVVSELGTDTHFVIDSGRNGNGPAGGLEAWCNPTGRALGRRPAPDRADPALDGFAWIKRPGESDGDCKGGPPAGHWFPQRALEMARNAAR